MAHLGVSQNYGHILGGPNIKDYYILVSILRSPDFGKLPFRVWSLGCRVSRIGVIGLRNSVLSGFKGLGFKVQELGLVRSENLGLSVCG